VHSHKSELWYSLAAVVLLTAGYAATYRFAGQWTLPSAVVGHGLGILGIVLMLGAETLYSIRKRLSNATWGSGAGWLRFHIFAGFVGPYAVLLHTAGRFSGLAGVSAGLMVVVVVSGVVGRYLFTRGGGDPSAQTPETPIPTVRKAFALWHAVHVPLTWVMFATALAHSIGALAYATLQR
jgi:hypothetical protein